MVEKRKKKEIVEDNHVESPTEFDVDPSLDENTKTLSKLLTDNAGVFATSDDDLKYPTILMKMHIATSDQKPIALKTYRIPLAHINGLMNRLINF